ncbi:MAG: aminopeptidase [Gracilibacter sp. BRH_c7a]|nr:MAG: aminopeptidase [Gracilibacter sp. BRH_c7a]
MFLKYLSELHGVSGNEKDVRDYIIENIDNNVDSYRVDKIGNLLATKKGKSNPAIKVVLTAHMDEVGLFITEITSEGYLKFQTIGYMDVNILVSKPVIINNSVYGVIGSKAIHLQKPEERKQSFLIDQLYIDIGANSKEEAEKNVKLGDYAGFTTAFTSFGSGFYKGKALDNRAGCAVIMELLKQQYNCDLTTVFTVQEELGLRGSKIISNYLNADLAIVVETTSAMDNQEQDRENWVVELGQGPACSLMDQATIYRPELIKKTIQIAESYGIPLQLREGTAAANDAGNIHLAGAGIPTITISIPCRYIHSMSSVISQSDYTNCIELINLILNNCQEYINLPHRGWEVMK